MNQKIIDKLRKLLAHAKSAKEIGNLAEAEAFAKKAQELIDSHNLSLSDVEIQELNSSINQTKTNQNAFAAWQKMFINAIARMNGCEVVFSSGEITLIGNEIDRMLVFEIYQYFEKLGRDLADNELKQWQSTVEYRRKRKRHYHSRLYKTSFLTGYVRTLIRRFREQNEIAKAASNNETALIFIGNKLTEANNWITNNLKTKSSLFDLNKSKLKDDPYRKGVAAGKSVALTTKTME